jgi:hypothetical protein
LQRRYINVTTLNLDIIYQPVFQLNNIAENNPVFWDVTSCGSFKNRRFRGLYCLRHQGDKNRRAIKVSSNYQSSHIVCLRCVLRLLATANVVPSSPIHISVMMEAIRSSETRVTKNATRRHIPEMTFFIVTAVKTSNLT